MEVEADVDSHDVLGAKVEAEEMEGECKGLEELFLEINHLLFLSYLSLFLFLLILSKIYNNMTQ